MSQESDTPRLSLRERSVLPLSVLVVAAVWAGLCAFGGKQYGHPWYGALGGLVLVIICVAGIRRANR